MISYCFTLYRPIYDRMLIEDLARKTTVRYEILVWINTPDPSIEGFVLEKARTGVPIRILGKTPENIGMVAYRHLISAAKGEMVVQIDDDVVRVSRRIAEIADGIFKRNLAKVKQIAADVVVDGFTWGNRAPIENYKPYPDEKGLLTGSVDGWFCIYHRSIVPLVLSQNINHFCSLGHMTQAALAKDGLHALLCTRFKVFHVVGAPYHSYYGMLDFEAAKWDSLRGPGGGDAMRKAGKNVPSREVLDKAIASIDTEMDREPSDWES
jgi:hypothetical protein